VLAVDTAQPCVDDEEPAAEPATTVTMAG
jgi:hypothetical protein